MTDPLKSNFWRTVFALACLVVMVAIFYAEENARGVRAWQKCERELAARGESLKWSDFIPAPVPDEKNFYRAPMMSEWFVKTTNYPSDPATNIFPTSNSETTENIITEITASNYVAWCAAFEPGFDLIRDAVKRPFARIDGDYRLPVKQPIPNFVKYRYLSQVLAHRAKCRLLLGKPAEALADLTLLHQLNQTLAKDGRPTTIVASMIHTAIAGLYADAIANGLQTHSWREPELAALQTQLAELQLLPAVAFSFRAERAGTCQTLDTWTPEQLMREIHGSTRQVSDLGWWLMPRGWVLQNKAVIASLEGKIVDYMNVTNHSVSPAKAVAANRAIERALEHVTPWNFIAAICLPNYTKASETMARNQTWVNHARIACALERHRLAHGNYPATLAALVPQFMETIPHDIIGGKAMNYSCPDGEHFRLYSIGWNEADDGGITAQSSDGQEDREHGDWVWHYPAR